jgi:phage terminase Nu1 subunit (DNA packaging protein)
MLLTGWKEIANYMQRGVRTVQRWERLGLPVRHLNKSGRSPLIAFSKEIDQWLARWQTTKTTEKTRVSIVEVAEAERVKLHKRVDALKRRTAELIQAYSELKAQGPKALRRNAPLP